MKTRFRRILCPIDFDRISIPALELAVSTAKQNDGRIYLLYIIPRMEAVGLRADVEQLATDSLRSVARKWLHGKVPYQIIVRTGAPVSGLLKAEAELSIDLVVMSTHGRTGRKHTLLGSVTEQVVRRSICPVLTTRPT
ncbi:MAG: universal stress protein [Candidatus Binataceae bacterium]|jgi:universal stress protein A